MTNQSFFNFQTECFLIKILVNVELKIYVSGFKYGINRNISHKHDVVQARLYTCFNEDGYMTHMFMHETIKSISEALYIVSTHQVH